ncbi:hypothetical protein ACSNOK_34900, partial [Streptomyces sp. URMC 126]|uniref:hypothetical protein n=1 Tax=Streptomyces sp. URMC 126 TaxID=3423401 RepID=UPI003F1C1F51
RDREWSIAADNFNRLKDGRRRASEVTEHSRHGLKHVCIARAQHDSAVGQSDGELVCERTR